ncbi:hypothetical protein FDUTEX481_02780 [Tolypothrix sp. PCC 7601]|nr:hypothetical protein FDUTEX481_02780 [Tolypothrix sp. PCC 7601]
MKITWHHWDNKIYFANIYYPSLRNYFRRSICDSRILILSVNIS